MIEIVERVLLACQILAAIFRHRRHYELSDVAACAGVAGIIVIQVVSFSDKFKQNSPNLQIFLLILRGAQQVDRRRSGEINPLKHLIYMDLNA